MDIEVSNEDFLRASEAIGAFATDEERFRALFDAFRAEDTDSFQRLLVEHNLFERCELVCEWVRSKECVLLCLELAGPPPERELPDPLEFAQVIELISGNEELVERLASAVAERDREAFTSLINDLDIERFSHLLCHWVCTIRGRLICRVICTPALPRLRLVDELTRAGQVLGRLAADKETFAAAAEAAFIGDCETLRAWTVKAGLRAHCELICEWFCTWRCIRVCLLLCRPFPFELIEEPLVEAFEFAKVTARLSSQPETIGRLAAAVDTADAKEFETLINELELQPFCIQLCHWICGHICHRFCFCVCPNPILQPWFTTVGYFDIYADIDATTGKTNKSLPYAGLSSGGGPNFAFHECLQLGGFCPSTSPSFAGAPMRYRFLYNDGSGPLPITGSSVCAVEAGTRLVDWPQNVAGIASAVLVSTFQTVQIAGAPQPDPIPPAPGAPWFGPAAHVIVPDAAGWINVDPNAIGGGFQTLIGFNTPQVVPGGAALPAVPAGTAVPIANQRTGTDLSITFEATRTTIATVDFTNALSKIHINNWADVNELWFVEYASGCCTPIDTTLGVEFTVDHEEMSDGAWSLAISSCSPSAPGDITPNAATPGVTLNPRGGSGTLAEDTSTWAACSYTVTLTNRPALTTGLNDEPAEPNSLTFCICGH